MSGLSIEDFEAFKKTPEAMAPPMEGAGDYIERQKAIIARDEADGYYENSPEADWENSQGSTGYTPLDEEDFDRAEQLLARKEVAREFTELPPSFSKKDEAREQSRALLSEQEWETVYDLGYADGYEDGKEKARQDYEEANEELRDQLGAAQLENLKLRKLLRG